MNTPKEETLSLYLSISYFPSLPSMAVSHTRTKINPLARNQVLFSDLKRSLSAPLSGVSHSNDANAIWFSVSRMGRVSK